MVEEEQNIIAVLLDVKEHKNLDVSDELIKGCYEIQQKYQFDEDRASQGEMEALIESYLEDSLTQSPE